MPFGYEGACCLFAVIKAEIWKYQNYLLDLKTPSKNSLHANFKQTKKRSA
jgi:hypothetical protein